MRALSILAAAGFVGLVSAGGVQAQWTTLVSPPQFSASTALLLTDGRVLCLDNDTVNWWLLVPTTTGGYKAAKWKAGPAMKYPREFFASAVLGNGKVVVAGGEDSGSLGMAEINKVEVLSGGSWSEIAKPVDPSGIPWTHIGDAPCAVLPDGSFFLGNIFTGWTSKLDPASLTWSSTGTMLNAASGNEAQEATWTLLPDGDVLTADTVFHPDAEYYYPTLASWFSAGKTTDGGGGDLVEASSTEIGPAILLPTGKLVAFGATGFNAFFHTSSYTWTPAPNSPIVTVSSPPISLPLGIKDGPACLLPNGQVLCAMGPVDGVFGDYLSPTYWELFDYRTNTFTQISGPATTHPHIAPFSWHLLMLPTGQVLATDGQAEAFLYNSPHKFPNSWRPTITSAPAIVYQGKDYAVSGTQFNGLSQCCAYGDDAACATNYPLARITNLGTGQVVYCRTHDHSTMAVATGSLLTTTNFTVPLNADSGSAHLVIIANGIESEPAALLVKQAPGS